MARERTVVSPVSIEERKGWNLTPGNTVKVWIKVQEKKKVRLQAFEGLIIARKHGTESGATFTVRKTSDGVGVEKIFPLYSPVIDRVEVLRSTRVRKAKLYYIRKKTAKEMRAKVRRILVQGRAAAAPAPQAEVEPEKEVEAETTEA